MTQKHTATTESAGLEASAPTDNYTAAAIAATAEAIAAIADLDAHRTDQIRLSLAVCEVISNARGSLEQGEFTGWRRDDLKKSPSWCSAYRRLFESREDLEAALAWAAMTEHKCASCRSVELLLKIITEWKRAARGDSAVAPKTRRKGDAIVVQVRRREIIAKLRQILEEAQHAFEALRYELALTAPTNDR